MKFVRTIVLVLNSGFPLLTQGSNSWAVQPRSANLGGLQPSTQTCQVPCKKSMFHLLSTPHINSSESSSAAVFSCALVQIQEHHVEILSLCCVQTARRKLRKSQQWALRAHCLLWPCSYLDPETGQFLKGLLFCVR